MVMSTAQTSRLRYPLIALAMIIALLLMHNHFSSKISSAISGKRAQTVTITNAGFVPNQLLFQEGDRISLMLVNSDSRPHNLVIGALKAFSANLQPNQSTTMEFAVEKKGTFDFISDSPGYPEAGYHGKLIVQ